MPFKFNPTTGQLDLVGSGGSGTIAHVEQFVLSLTDISNKFVMLSSAPTIPADTMLLVKDAGNMFYGDDFSISGNHLTWNVLGLDGILSFGDKLTVYYI